MRRVHRRSRATRANTNVVVGLFVPLLLITISAFAYGQWSTQLTCLTTLNAAQEDVKITKWVVNSTNTVDVDGDGIIMGDELQIIEVTDAASGQIVGLEITVDPIFPGWMLHLILEIYNRPLPYSVPVNVTYEMEYWNTTSGQWETITPSGLQELFYITYIDGFYLDAGLTQPAPPNYVLPVDSYIYKSEYLMLSENAPQTLEGQSIQFRAVIYAEWAGV